MIKLIIKFTNFYFKRGKLILKKNLEVKFLRRIFSCLIMFKEYTIKISLVVNIDLIL
jgi:hypothetical protein